MLSSLQDYLLAAGGKAVEGLTNGIINIDDIKNVVEKGSLKEALLEKNMSGVATRAMMAVGGASATLASGGMQIPSISASEMGYGLALYADGIKGILGSLAGLGNLKNTLQLRRHDNLSQVPGVGDMVGKGGAAKKPSPADQAAAQRLEKAASEDEAGEMPEEMPETLDSPEQQQQAARNLNQTKADPLKQVTDNSSQPASQQAGGESGQQGQGSNQGSAQDPAQPETGAEQGAEPEAQQGVEPDAPEPEAEQGAEPEQKPGQDQQDPELSEEQQSAAARNLAAEKSQALPGDADDQASGAAGKAAGKATSSVAEAAVDEEAGLLIVATFPENLLLLLPLVNLPLLPILLAIIFGWPQFDLMGFIKISPDKIKIGGVTVAKVSVAEKMLCALAVIYIIVIHLIIIVFIKTLLDKISIIPEVDEVLDSSTELKGGFSNPYL